MKKIALCISAVTVVFITSSVYAGEPLGDTARTETEYARPDRPMRRSRDRGKTLKNLVTELSLTAEQQEGMRKHRDENRIKTRETQERLRVKMKELKAKLEQYDADRKSVYKIAEEVNALKGSLFKLRIERTFFMKELLTPEQYEMFKNKVASRVRRHKGWGGKFNRGKKRPRGPKPGTREECQPGPEEEL